jgi:hypothetical protein
LRVSVAASTSSSSVESNSATSTSSRSFCGNGSRPRAAASRAGCGAVPLMMASTTGLVGVGLLSKRVIQSRTNRSTIIAFRVRSSFQNLLIHVEVVFEAGKH